MLHVYCSDCGRSAEAADAFDVIRVNKWKFEVQRNRHGKIIAKLWHCEQCKCRNKRPSQAPTV